MPLYSSRPYAVFLKPICCSFPWPYAVTGATPMSQGFICCITQAPLLYYGWSCKGSHSPQIPEAEGVGDLRRMWQTLWRPCDFKMTHGYGNGLIIPPRVFTAFLGFGLLAHFFCRIIDSCNLWLSPVKISIWLWCISLSIKAAVKRLSPNTVFHWPNSRFVVIIRLFRS